MLNHGTIFFLCKSIIIQVTAIEKQIIIVCYISLGKKGLMYFYIT